MVVSPQIVYVCMFFCVCLCVRVCACDHTTHDVLIPLNYAGGAVPEGQLDYHAAC